MSATQDLTKDLITKHELRFERVLPSPVETVWAYLGDPVRLRTLIADELTAWRIGHRFW